MVESTRLGVEAFMASLLGSALVLCMAILFGDGIAGFFLSASLSLSFDIPMLFGLEKSFIFDFSLLLTSFSGAGDGACSGGKPGEYNGLRGKAAFAAVAAVSLRPPMKPS